MRALLWLLRAAVFFALFAFALNNQHEAVIKWFFGHEWRAPMVFIVLAAFGVGCALGITAMLPSWWQHRRAARTLPSAQRDTATSAQAGADDRATTVEPPLLEHPPRDGV